MMSGCCSMDKPTEQTLDGWRTICILRMSDGDEPTANAKKVRTDRAAKRQQQHQHQQGAVDDVQDCELRSEL